MQRNAIIELKNIRKSYEMGDEAFWALIRQINIDEPTWLSRLSDRGRLQIKRS